MGIEVSVIIPVYNVEKYLKRCVDSILSQTLKEIEIILIDDGSTDSSGKVCDEYSEKDNRILVIHKKNARVAAARNDGIKLARGKYISFIDSDDWIEPHMYEIMMKKAEELELDFIMCDFIKRGVEKEYRVSQPIDKGFYDRNRIKKDLFPCLIMFENIELPSTISNCTCLFNREFLFENNIFYDEDIHYCEDSIFGSKAMYNANRFYYMKENYFYNYFYNPNSTTTNYNEKKWDSYLKINDRLKEYFGYGEFDFSRQIKINMLYFTLNMLSEIGRSNYSFNRKRKLCENIMNNHKVKYIFNKFKLPEVSIGLNLVNRLIKYRLCFIYSFIFYRRRILRGD